MTERGTYGGLSLISLFSALFRHKAGILMIFVVTVVTVTAGVYLWPETYEARAALLIKLGKEHIGNPMMTPSPQQQVLNTGLRAEDINSEIKILGNRYIIEKAVDKLGTDALFPQPAPPTTFLQKVKSYMRGIYRGLADFVEEVLISADLVKRLSLREKAVQSVQRRLSVEPVKNSDVIEIRLLWGDPDGGRELVEALIAYYLEHHVETHRFSHAYDFLSRQVSVAEQLLRDQENKLRSLKERHNITSHQDQRKLLLEQLSTLKGSLNNTEAEIDVVSSKVRDIRGKIESLQRLITPGFGIVYKEAEKELLVDEVQLSGLEARRAALQKQTEVMQRELDRLNASELELQRLDRQIRIDEKTYQLYRERLEEARISNVQDSERMVNVRVIEPANASLSPVRPRKLLVISIGLFISVMAGVFFAFVSEYFNHSFRDEEEIERHLNLRVLASIPEFRE